MQCPWNPGKITFNEIKEQIEVEGIVMADIKRIDDIVEFAAA